MGDFYQKVTIALWVTGRVREIKKQGLFHKEIFAVVVGATYGLCIVWVFELSIILTIFI